MSVLRIIFKLIVAKLHMRKCKRKTDDHLEGTKDLFTKKTKIKKKI